MEAIRQERLAAFERAADAYRELLLAVPIAWGRHNLRLTENLAMGVGPFQPGMLALIERHLFEAMRETMRQGDPEMTSVATGLPFRIAADAVPLAATGLVRRMLSLLVAGYYVAARLDDEAARASSTTSCLARTFELVRYFVLPQAQGEAPRQLSWEEAVDLTERVDVGDPKGVSAVDERWSDLFSLWRPDIEGPNEALVELEAAQCPTGRG